MSDVILSVPVDAGGVDPLLASLEKIRENLAEINTTSKSSLEVFSKSLDKSNKKLKETDKTFGDIFKKIKLSGLMKMGAGIIGGAAGLAGITTGAMLFGALKNSAGNIGTRYAGFGLGMSSAEMKALQTASKLTTGKEDTLTNALTNLSNALASGTGAGALANLGLNQEALRAMKPEDALEAVFGSVKGKGTGVGFEYLRDAFTSVTGLSGQDYNVATKQGASFEGHYNEFLRKYGGVDFEELGRGSESLIKFQTGLDVVSSKLGAQLGDPLVGVLDKLTPHIERLGDRLAKLLDSITQEDVDNFVKNVEKIFEFIGSVASGLFTSINDPGKITKIAAEAQTGGASGKLAATSGSLALQTFLNLFSEEGRESNKRFGVENSIRSFMAAGYDVSQLRKLNSGLVAQATEYGYISGNSYTEKANALRVEVVVKDPAGNVLSSAVTTQGAPKPGNPMGRGR